MPTPYSSQHHWLEWLVDVQTPSRGCDCPYAFIPFGWVLQEGWAHPPPLLEIGRCGGWGGRLQPAAAWQPRASPSRPVGGPGSPLGKGLTTAHSESEDAAAPPRHHHCAKDVLPDRHVGRTHKGFVLCATMFVMLEEEGGIVLFPVTAASHHPPGGGTVDESAIANGARATSA